ncbi:MAG: hypothetical protein EAZ43_06870 [Betaproteobacteria bacterium]|nr:MAG: hypothetical protein EAZ43_06870 [Betaproteobacteria bacterium]
MLLLPASLPSDPRILTALCDGLPPHTEIAQFIRSASVAAFEGSWGDAEHSLDLTPIPANADRTVATASPMHAALGLSDLTPMEPSQLQLTDIESRALCEATDALMRDEGVRLTWIDALNWRVDADRVIDVKTERPDWIIGESMRPNLPRGTDARLVERWMNELQMLLFDHPVNSARQSRGLPVVNVLWLWGFVAASVVSASATQPVSNEAHFDARMLIAFRSGDLAAWQRAWGELATTITKQPAIILGDTQSRLILNARPVSVISRLTAMIAPPKLSDALHAMCAKLDAATR